MPLLVVARLLLGDVKETYRLENADLIVETIRRTPAGTFTGTTVYRKP